MQVVPQWRRYPIVHRGGDYYGTVSYNQMMKSLVLLIFSSVLFSFIFLWMGISGIIATGEDYDAWWQDQYTRQKDMMNTRDFDLLLAGDSITRRFESTGLVSWNRYIRPYKPLNFGIDGDTTDQLIYRLEQAPPGSSRPGACTILIGVNDLIRGEEPGVVAEKIHLIIILLADRYPESTVYLFCIFPAENPPGKLRSAINETNTQVKEYPYPRNVRIVDLTDLFTTDTGILSEAISDDHLHLSKKGYEIWGAVIHQIITGNE